MVFAELDELWEAPNGEVDSVDISFPLGVDGARNRSRCQSAVLADHSTRRVTERGEGPEPKRRLGDSL